MANETVLTRIADERKALGWTQAELGDRVGMTQGQVSNLERGVNAPSGIRTAFAIADALGVDVRVLWPHLSGPLPRHLPQHRQPEAAARRRSAPRRAAKKQGKAKR